jgi:hypothetical protein
MGLTSFERGPLEEGDMVHFYHSRGGACVSHDAHHISSRAQTAILTYHQDQEDQQHDEIRNCRARGRHPRATNAVSCRR